MFSLYHTLTNNEYITVGGHYYIPVTNIGCYDTVKGEVVIFFIYSLGFYIGFYFTFIILMMMMKRHMTLQSHDMSHDVMS